MASEVRVAILGDSRDFSRAVRDARQDADRLDGTFNRVSDGARRMSTAMRVAAVGGIALGVHAVRGFLEAAEESQQVTRQTAAVIRSMGNVANVSATQVARLSTQLSLKTGIDDEVIQSGQNVLLTFGQIRNEVGEGNNVFDRATEAALNMSVALGTDLNSAAMMVGKALNDPIRGLTALRRSGIQFTETQEDMIRALVESGDVMGAQRIMLAELDRQFGGSAEAQATASDKLRVAWGNIQEQIGGALLPAFESVATWLTERLPSFMTSAGEVVDNLRVKWEEFTTALFGEEDWDSFWADVTAGVDEFNRRWDDFTTDLTRGWEEFTTVMFDEESWDSFWADVGAGLERVGGWIDAVERRWQDFVGLFTETGRDIAQFFGGLDRALGGSGGGEGALDTLIGGVDQSQLVDPNDFRPNLAQPWIGSNFGVGAPLTPIRGPFHSGGVVPGPLGSNQLAMVAGGETILPTHRNAGAGMTLIVNGEPDEFTLHRLRTAAVAAAIDVRRAQAWSVG